MKEPRRFVALDSWRGLCALLVACYHIHSQGAFESLAFSRGCFLLVDFFFVLSGFVMSQAYGAELGSASAVMRFGIRRFGRLWPLRGAVLLAFVAVALVKLIAMTMGYFNPSHIPFSGEESWPALAANLAFLNAMRLLPSLTWNTPSWSIGAEFWAYIVFAILAWRKQKLFAWWAGGKGTFWEVVAVGAVFGFITVSYNNNLSFVAPVVFAGVVLIFAHGEGRLSSWLGQSLCQALGAWSYSIYMLHAFVIARAFEAIAVADKLAAVYPKLGGVLALSSGPVAREVITLGLLAVIVGLAAQTYRWIETPSRRFFNGLAKAAGA